jgi:hypothetical protein
MNIKETFLKLTSRTYPHKTESEILHLLPGNLETDGFGNKYFIIGENPTVMFTSHLDTATPDNTPVNHVIEGDIIKTDGKSILGADDKSGVTIMLYMMSKGVKGLYYFFLGEEVGCLGSKWLSEQHAVTPDQYVKKVVSFDRRGTDSVITFQSSSRCCSEDFATALSKELNEKAKTLNIDFAYKNDPTGVYTDSAKFTKIYPECTNISVGYQSEHTFSESQNIDHLEKLAKTVCLVDWEILPVSRDPAKVEYSYYGGNFRNYYAYDWDNYDDYPTKTGNFRNYPTKKTEKHWFLDDDYLSSVDLDDNGGVVSVSFSKIRINDELDLIQDVLDELDVPYKTITWNGLDLKLEYPEHKAELFKFNTTVSREELSQYIPELLFWVDEVEKEEKDQVNLLASYDHSDWE